MSIVLNSNPKMCIDAWMQYFSVNPLSFNNIEIQTCVPDFYVESCSNYWQQWQYETTTFSKEQLGFYLETAEQQIENYLGSFVKPTWVCQEEHVLPYNYKRNKGHPHDFYNIQFQTNWKNVMAFGQPMQTLLGNFPITYVDQDLDGFQETAIVTFNLTTALNLECPNTFKLYFAGQNGNSHYEICNYRTFEYDNTTLIGTITFDAWILLDPALYTVKSFIRGRAIDGCNVNNFVNSIDIYFESINTCLPMAELVWSKSRYSSTEIGFESCYICGANCNCSEYRRPACVKVLDYCKGIFNVEIQKYDDETGCVIPGSCRCVPCKPPDAIRINYLSGCHVCDHTNNNNLCNRGICSQLIKPIIMLSISNMPNTDCSCKCVETQLKYWGEDVSYKSMGGGSYNYPLSLLQNTINGIPKRGAIEATMMLENFKNNNSACYNAW